MKEVMKELTTKIGERKRLGLILQESKVCGDIDQL